MNKKKTAQSRKLSAQILLLFLAALFCLANAEAKKKPPSAPLDLNSATPTQLEQLPGIGPSAAQSIVDFRTKSGPFRRVEDLLAIRGISQRKLNEMRPYVMVASATAPKAQPTIKNGVLSKPKPGGADDAGCE
jgi:competence ComEA-like helix-hairpin-helix protein